ncbi:MAG TPA: alpha/beta hydrolase [Methylomirabilota bacterium]|nr:alpha/beta hydrolase [Methylomirabilota bacterium]
MGTRSSRGHDRRPAAGALLVSDWTTLPAGVIHALAGRRVPGRPAVVLVHGMVVSSRYMAPTAERLAPLCNVYAPDLPGYGKSYKPRPILRLPQLADALATWMEAVHLDRAHLVANSFGCQIVAEFAVRHAARVRRLVLQGPTVDPAARTMRQQIWRSILNSPNEPKSLGWVSLKDYRAAGLRRAWMTFKLVLADRIEDKLPHIDAPAMVVRGERDPIVPQQWAEEVARLLPRGELRVMPGVGHTINYAAPRQFVDLIRPFLRL